MSSNPGIGFSIGSGGNGYRPSIIIAVWTDQPFSVSTGLATIKSHFNVSSNPVTTNGDCAISCDGTVQPEESSSSQIVVESQPEPVQQTDQNVVEQPVLIQQPEQQEQAPAPQVLPDNTPQYTIPTVTLEPFSSYATPGDVVAQSPISNKKIIKRNKITTKKARAYATSKTKR
jgi:hypothetical protein